MSAPPAIEVHDVSKFFRRWEHQSLKTLLLGGLGREQPRFRALHDVSFRVERGEFVALIGPNGSGKSTLFKLISGIYPTDGGNIRCHGRVAPLIELNAGFHPDFTGWENLFLNASILGLSQREIRRRSDDIVDYAGVRAFMDTPTRFYSSGMLSRLAFAINVFVDAEILLVDEVLAVGDEQFQHRCLNTLREKHRNGVTIVFVTHDLAAVERETQRAIWLDGGRVRMDGPASQVVESYRQLYGAGDPPKA
ncbi:MAG: ABC transporter ATP-binding protein [Myxococcota bacterium]